MKKNTLILGVAAVALAAAGFSAPSFAARQKLTPEQRSQRMIERLDTNADKKVSLDEMETPLAAMFKTADANGDGQVTRQEIKAQRMAMRQARKDWHDAKAAGKTPSMDRPEEARVRIMPMGGRMFKRADADKNGSLSLAEVTDATARMFKRRDVNGDGFIDATDLSKKI